MACTSALGPAHARCTGHHRTHAAWPTWAVQWRSGLHRVVLVLQPSPGAWAFVQGYFDRAPAALAVALVAQAFEPWFNNAQGTPWVAGPTAPAVWAAGGADGQMVVPSRALSLEFSLGFADLASATAWAATATGPVPAAPAMPDYLPLRCALRLARIWLPVHRLADLRPGDVLLAATPAHAMLLAGWPARVVAHLQRSDGTRWRMAPAPAGWRPEDEVMNDDLSDLNPAPHDAAGPLLDELPVAVDIVAGRLSLALAELQAMRPGDLLPLAAPLDGAEVQLQLGGRTWARGMLVALGDHLAVQLTHIGAARSGHGSAR